MYDYLIVGAGLFGATVAQVLKKAGKTVLVVDKRDHIAGNAFTEKIESINVHRYGAHIFHTNSKEVWDYLNSFATFNRYTNCPMAIYKGEIFSLPFNMHTFSKMWNVINPDEAAEIIEKQRSEIKDVPSNLEEQAISLVGRDIYEKLIKGYTEKQWGRNCTELPPFIIKRLPVRMLYDNNYFNALYQGIPIGGYTKMVSNMLSGCDVLLGVDYLSRKEELDKKANRVIFTGSIDSYYSYCYGHLEYRSVRFENAIINKSNFQGNAVVNYTEKEIPWTRIIEHKWFEFGKDEFGNDIPVTIISKEFPSEWQPGDEPFYPVNDKKNQDLFLKYKALSSKEDKVLFGGRLGEYKYYDMDQVVLSALELSKFLLSNDVE